MNGTFRKGHRRWVESVNFGDTDSVVKYPSEGCTWRKNMDKANNVTELWTGIQLQ